MTEARRERDLAVVIVVRPATPGDIDSVVALERDHLGPEPWSEPLISAGIHGSVPTVRYLVAEISGTVVGHAVASTAGDVAELQRIAVASTSRRRGVAGQLIRAVTAVAVAAGAERLLLEVREGNEAALALYAREGFVELHRRPRYYRDGATAIVLGRDLDRLGTMEA